MAGMSADPHYVYGQGQSSRSSYPILLGMVIGALLSLEKVVATATRGPLTAQIADHQVELFSQILEIILVSQLDGDIQIAPETSARTFLKR